MIIHHIIIGLLLYSTLVAGHPTVNPEKENSTTNQINSVSDSVNDSFSDTAVDTLITKVVELSERYRKDINGTIADVQQMIQADKTLPRLTRGEIIDLLENLTRTTPDAWREKIVKSRKDYQRAIMLVMPYTPKNSDSSSIEELYTKPPVTHIIGSETSKPGTRKPQNINKHIEILALEPSTSRPPIVKRPYKPVKQLKPEPIHETKTQQSYHPEYKPKKEVIIKQIPPKPEITTYKPYITTHKPDITTHKPEFATLKPEISTRRQMMPKPTRFSNHRYPDERDFVPSNQGMKIISAPSLAPKPETVNSEFSQAEKLVKPEIQPDWQPEKEIKPMPFEKPNRNVRPVQSSVYKVQGNSNMRPRIRSTTTTSTQSPFANLDLPDDMKDAVKDVHFGGLVPMKPPKFSSQYDGASINFPKQEASTENVRDLLDSIGVLPVQTSTVVPDISEIADTLSPDMRDLLMSFGLLEDPNKPARDLSQPIITQPNSEEYDITPYSYTQFKPLPDSAPSREDMQEFLAGFGLTGNSQRSAKKLKTPEEPFKLPTHLLKVPDINMEMIPESMHEILEDIGLSEKKERKIPLDQESKETHVFNPEQTYVSETEIKRLNQLLETIKRLEKLNRTATPEDLKDLDLENIRELTKILKQDATVPLDQQNFGPDPLDFDLSPEKNEVKRQESTTTSTEKAAEEIKEDEAKNPSLAALEESFGGNAGAAAENVDESLPPPRRTGFYYLVDWNSFLEVGEEGKNKVNIRFSPQAGDASRFLRVNVP